MNVDFVTTRLLNCLRWVIVTCLARWIAYHNIFSNPIIIITITENVMLWKDLPFRNRIIFWERNAQTDLHDLVHQHHKTLGDFYFKQTLQTEIIIDISKGQPGQLVIPKPKAWHITYVITHLQVLVIGNCISIHFSSNYMVPKPHDQKYTAIVCLCKLFFYFRYE